MILVEVYENGDAPVMKLELSFMPRVGEYLSIEDGYFTYYNIVEVWQRRSAKDKIFQACIRVERED